MIPLVFIRLCPPSNVPHWSVRPFEELFGEALGMSNQSSVVFDVLYALLKLLGFRPPSGSLVT
jgi:hypothetical protein